MKNKNEIYVEISSKAEAQELIKILKEAKEEIFSSSDLNDVNFKDWPRMASKHYSDGEWGFYVNLRDKTKVTLHELAEILGVIKEFKVGDKVEIVDLPEIGSEFEGFSFTYSTHVADDLKIGDIVTITSIGDNKSIRVDTISGNNWVLSPSSVKLINKIVQVNPTVTREALAEVYPLVCSEWQSLISLALSEKKSLFSNTIEVVPLFLERAYKEWPTGAHSEEVKAWLDKYLPKPKVEVEKTITLYGVRNTKEDTTWATTYKTRVLAEEAIYRRRSTQYKESLEIVKLTGTYKTFE